MKKQEVTLPIAEAKESAITVWLKKINSKVCKLKKNVHLCNALHFEQATRFANIVVGIFCACGFHIVPSRVMSVMDSLPVQGVMQRGAELFCSLPVFNQYNCFI